MYHGQNPGAKRQGSGQHGRPGAPGEALVLLGRARSAERKQAGPPGLTPIALAQPDQAKGRKGALWRTQQQCMGSACSEACQALAHSHTEELLEKHLGLLECTEVDMAESKLGVQRWKLPQFPCSFQAPVALQGPPG